MKTIIAIALFTLAMPAYAANDRVLFMCSVGTAHADECPVPEVITPVERPMQVNLAPEPMILATSTTAEAEKIEQLKALIEQLQLLIAQLKAQKANAS